MIPRKIHTIWTKPTAPTQIQNNINSLRNINKGWEHVLWTPKLMRGYLTRRNQHWLRLWDKINPNYGVIYADVFRYIIIRDVGGVYLDAKSLITHKLDKVIDLNAGAYIAGDRYTGWLQWFLISAPGHPIMYETTRRVFTNMAHYDVNRDGVGRNATLNLAGPTPYTQAVNARLDRESGVQVTCLDPLPHWLVYDTIGSAERERDASHYSNQSEPLLWP